MFAKRIKHRTYEIPNSKHQITNKSQIPILNDQNRFGISNFGHCNLFDICDLIFVIFFLQYFNTPKSLAIFKAKAIEI